MRQTTDVLLEMYKWRIAIAFARWNLFIVSKLQNNEINIPPFKNIVSFVGLSEAADRSSFPSICDKKV